MDLNLLDGLLNGVTTFLNTLSGWVRPYLNEIGLAMASTLLVVYGNEITGWLRGQIGSLGFVLKVTLFVIFCAVGFSFIMSFITPAIINLLAQLNNLLLGVVVITAFFAIGVVAKKRGMI
jgi:hypothetical protein